jgi:repressor LexA
LTLPHGTDTMEALSFENPSAQISEAKMPKTLTSLERRILDFLIEYLRKNTYQPSIREIGKRFGIKSTKTVSEYLQALADKGWVERDPSRSRGVRLIGVEVNAETVSVPHVAAPSNGSDGIVEAFELDRKLVGGSGAFCVAMQGNGLEDDGIRDGDLLLVEPAEAKEIEDGDLVCYLSQGDERAVHRFGRANGRGGEGAPAGRVVSVVRRLRRPSMARAARET